VRAGGDWIDIGDTNKLNQPFPWTVPDGTRTHEARVKVKVFNGGAIQGEDASDSTFTIWSAGAPCAVRLVAPNGGENWSAGSTHNVEWDVSSSCSPTALDLRYRENPQESWKKIAEMAYNAGPYAWTIPSTIPTTDDAQVRIDVWSGGNHVGDDDSDYFFTIWNGGGGGGCTLTLTSPHAGDNISANTVYQVTWTYSGCTDAVGARIWWTPDSISWAQVADNLPKGGPYDWNVPNIPTTDDAQMQVSLFNSQGTTVKEAGTGGRFMVWNGPLPPCDLKVDAPAKGDNWSAKSVQTISWTINGCASATAFDAEWGVGDNGPWEHIREGHDIHAPVQWVVPDVATTNDAFVRITLWSSGVVIKRAYGGAFTIWNGLAPPLGGVVIEGEIIAAKIGEAVPLKATAVDSDGNAIPNAALSFALEGEIGAIDRENNLLAMTRGSGLVKATAMVGDAAKTTQARAIAYLLTYKLSGKVLAGSDSVAGAKLEAYIMDSDLGLLKVAETTSAADGSYSLEMLETQTYIVRAKAAGYNPADADGIVADADKSVDIQMVKPSTQIVVPGFPWYAYFIVGVGMVGTLTAVGLWLATTEAGLMALGALAFIVLSRIKRESVLDHFLRGQIYGCILSSPGITYNRIKRRVGASNGTLAYHLHTLEREGFIRSMANGQYRQFFPLDVRPVKANEMLLSRLQEAILGLVRTTPGIAQAEITAKLEAKRQSVSYNVRRLRDMGLIKIGGWGRMRRCFPAEPGAVSFGVGAT
jgi:DNA-binding MarR family transcriptional regulator